jgi:hypothetical protein
MRKNLLHHPFWNLLFCANDIAKFVSDPASPPRLVDIPEEGKGKAKECREVGEGEDTVTIEDTTDEEDGERSRSGFSCDPGSADLGCPTSPSLKIHRLAWRLVSLRRRGGRAMWRANMLPKS